jgi:hypothetical protein
LRLDRVAVELGEIGESTRRASHQVPSAETSIKPTPTSVIASQTPIELEGAEGIELIAPGLSEAPDLKRLELWRITNRYDALRLGPLNHRQLQAYAWSAGIPKADLDILVCPPSDDEHTADQVT